METKPSIYTSEFWLHLLLQVILFLNTSHVWTYMSPKWSGIVQGIILSAYMLSRGWAKSSSTADPNVPANHKSFLAVRSKDMHTRTR